MSKITLTEAELLSLVNRIVEQRLSQTSEQFDDMDDDFEDEDGEEMVKYPVDDIEFDLDDSDVQEIMSFDGPFRQFRGSIYVDGIVPETDDREYDRQLALKLMDYYRKQISNMENYVGGVGFKNRGNLLEPYDNMDF